MPIVKTVSLYDKVLNYVKRLYKVSSLQIMKEFKTSYNCTMSLIKELEENKILSKVDINGERTVLRNINK